MQGRRNYAGPTEKRGDGYTTRRPFAPSIWETEKGRGAKSKSVFLVANSSEAERERDTTRAQGDKTVHDLAVSPLSRFSSRLHRLPSPELGPLPSSPFLVHLSHSPGRRPPPSVTLWGRATATKSGQKIGAFSFFVAAKGRSTHTCTYCSTVCACREGLRTPGPSPAGWHKR